MELNKTVYGIILSEYNKIKYWNLIDNLQTSLFVPYIYYKMTEFNKWEKVYHKSDGQSVSKQDWLSSLSKEEMKLYLIGLAHDMTDDKITIEKE